MRRIFRWIHSIFLLRLLTDIWTATGCVFSLFRWIHRFVDSCICCRRCVCMQFWVCVKNWMVRWAMVKNEWKWIHSYFMQNSPNNISNRLLYTVQTTADICKHFFLDSLVQPHQKKNTSSINLLLVFTVLTRIW